MLRNTVRLALIICLMATKCLSVAAQENEALKNFLKNKSLRHAAVGFKAVDLKTGKTIATFNENMAITPASNIKLITTASAINIYGRHFRYKTTVLHEGQICDSILNGNLYVQGAGDPTLGSESLQKEREHFLKEWLSAIKNAGIKSISGNIVIIDSLFGYNGVSEKWLVEDVGTDYAQGIFGICVFDNIFSPESKDNNKKRVSLADPGLFLSDYFKKFLEDNGLKVEGRATTYRLEMLKSLLSGTTFDVPENMQEIGAVYSPCLTEIVREINVNSNNLFAEHLYRKMLSDSINIKALWQSQGLDSTALIMYDGSGLSPQNATSADYLTSLLVFMNRQQGEHKNEFYLSLPLAGKEGTVADFLKNTTFEGKMYVKSGSMSGVQCYSGYVEKGIKRYAFSLLVNNFSGERKELKKAIERFFVALFS
ncbi:MAG: D-alanyl-D-alanine carboxypeptidase [Dysgonamonadaceae bacterium]|jgi:D-alanyl-D-alanine carboxypeptidase/D-alanyl-D-alanine-endopeptidase (penicillin-binding protein 4)|nr:D-alanyl-D-alanine carboxypeptidase [Dysgonamonadaceae bacterium]